MRPQKSDMRQNRAHKALILLLIFCSYYAGISLFSHTHIANGSSVVHSHLGGSSEHNHSESQYAVIDILSNFQSETVVDPCCVSTPFFQLSEIFIGYEAPSFLSEVLPVRTLRGPPAA